jgi:hypothetical protein
MIGIPQFCGHKQLFTVHPGSGQSCLQRLADFTFVPISFRTIEVPKSGVQRVSGSTDGPGCIGNQGAKPKHGHMAGAVTEGKSHGPKVRRLDHDVRWVKTSVHKSTTTTPIGCEQQTRILPSEGLSSGSAS